jgi:hypothetical protein
MVLTTDERFVDAEGETNGTMVRSDIVESLRRIHDATGHEALAARPGADRQRDRRDLPAQVHPGVASLTSCGRPSVPRQKAGGSRSIRAWSRSTVARVRVVPRPIARSIARTSSELDEMPSDGSQNHSRPMTATRS